MDESIISNKTEVEDVQCNEVTERYNSLKKQYDNLASNFEALNQELHETRRGYETALEMQSHVRADLELYKVEEQKQRDNLLSTITVLQEETSSLRNKRSEISDQYAARINMLKAENHRLRKENSTESRKTPERDTNEVEQIQCEISSATYELDLVKSALEEARAEVLTWRLKFEELMAEIRELREAADIRKEEIKNAEEKEAIALAELAETRAMLNQIDSGDQPLAKGNSIFAEVEDKRQEIAKNLLQIKQSNAKLRQEIANKQTAVEILLHEKQTIWEEQAGATAHHDQDLIDSYEHRITQLEALCERQRRELCRWFGKISDPTTPGWLPELIEQWKLECEKLRRDLLAQTPIRISSGALIRELQRKLALLSTDTLKQSPAQDNKNEISVYKVPAKVEPKKLDVRKKVTFN